MKKLLLLIGISFVALTIGAQEKETPNAQQARRMFNETYKMVFGSQGSRLHYKVNIIGYDAHSDERDKYATKFKFEPDNYTYSIKDSEEGYYITLKAKKGVKGIKEARCLLDKQNRYPVSVRIKVGIFHTTIKISQFKVGGIEDDLFEFPHDEYKNCKFIDKR